MMKDLSRQIGATLFLLLLVAGCRPNEQELCLGEDNVLFFDNFDPELNCGWVQYDDSGLVAEFDAGSLQLVTSQPGKIAWTNPGRSFGDVVVSVRTRQVDGPNDNAYGVICRYVNEENFYIFLIGGDGFYVIGKYETGRPQIEYLTEDNAYIYSEVINQGAATNDIQVSCIGNQLSLTVNGLRLLTIEDDSFAEGDIGLGASTLDPGTITIQFDNLVVSQP